MTRIDYQPWLYRKTATDEQRGEQQALQQRLAAEAGATFGQDCFVAPGAKVFTSRLVLGDRTWIAADANLAGEITFGADCSVNFFAVLEGNITIGDGVRIAPHAVIMAANHGHERVDIPIFRQPGTSKGITIEDDVWIGAGVKVLDGVRVGAHSILAAGAVVTKDIPPYSICAGVPARVIRDRRTGRRPAATDSQPPVAAGNRPAADSRPAAADSDLAAQLTAFGKKVRDQWQDVLASHWDGQAFLDRQMGRPELTSLCCAVEIAALYDQVPPQYGRDDLIRLLRSTQDPASGLCPDPWAGEDVPPEQSPSGSYGMMAVGYALECLGSGLAYPVSLHTSMTPELLYQRLRALPWNQQAWRAGSWVDVHGTGLCFSKLHCGADISIEPLFGWLNLHMSPATGVWGQWRPADGWQLPVNGFYRLTRGTYAQFGVPLPYPERTIDTVLAHTRDVRFFGPDRGTACDVLDVAHPLWLASRQTDYRRDEIRACAAPMLRRALGRWRDGLGFSFTLEGDQPENLHYTEQWIATIYILAELLGVGAGLGYRPRGIHRMEPACPFQQIIAGSD